MLDDRTGIVGVADLLGSADLKQSSLMNDQRGRAKVDTMRIAGGAHVIDCCRAGGHLVDTLPILCASVCQWAGEKIKPQVSFCHHVRWIEGRTFDKLENM